MASEAVEELMRSHRNTITRHLVSRFQDAASRELANMSRITDTDPDEIEVSGGEELNFLIDRTMNKVVWYDQELDRYAEEEGVENVYEEGVPLSRRSDQWVKWVDPDGNAQMREMDVSYNDTVRPNIYFGWVAGLAAKEAQTIAQFKVQRELDEVEAHVWRSSLDDLTTPVSARLHGVVFEEPSVFPPLSRGSVSELEPIFFDDTDPARMNPDLDQMEEEREMWFHGYHLMRQGKAPERGWSDMDTESNKSPEFLYNEYLPRKVEDYLPINNAE